MNYCFFFYLQNCPCILQSESGGSAIISPFPACCPCSSAREALKGDRRWKDGEGLSFPLCLLLLSAVPAPSTALFTSAAATGSSSVCFLSSAASRIQDTAGPAASVASIPGKQCPFPPTKGPLLHLTGPEILNK